MKIFSADDQQQQQQQTQQQQQLESMDVMPSMTASPSAPAFLTKDGQTSSPVLSKDSRLGGLQTHLAPSPLFVSFFLSFFLSSLDPVWSTHSQQKSTHIGRSQYTRYLYSPPSLGRFWSWTLYLPFFFFLLFFFFFYVKRWKPCTSWLPRCRN